jgi:CheY-like chemotaxis protein
MNSGKTHGMEILLVEDSLSNANLTIEALKQGNVQCRVTLVCDGEEAIRFLCRKGEFARAPIPDLILLDMSLPKQDGRQVLAEIRSDEELKDISVIVLTAASDHEAILKAEGLHVDGFMTKPVEWTTFIETVKSLRRSRLMQLLQTP